MVDVMRQLLTAHSCLFDGPDSGVKIMMLNNKRDLPTWRNSKTNTATESSDFRATCLNQSQSKSPEAEYCRGLNKLPSMSHQAAPTSDTGLIVYLISVLLFMATAFLTFYQMTRPTVLPNAGVAAFEREKRVPVTLSWISSQDAEQLAVETALLENEQQGLLPLTAAKQTDKDALLTLRAAGIETVRTPNAAAIRPPKVKRVVKVQARARVPQGQDALAYAPHGRTFAPSSGFEPWLR